MWSIFSSLHWQPHSDLPAQRRRGRRLCGRVCLWEHAQCCEGGGGKKGGVGGWRRKNQRHEVSLLGYRARDWWPGTEDQHTVRACTASIITQQTCLHLRHVPPTVRVCVCTECRRGCIADKQRTTLFEKWQRFKKYSYCMYAAAETHMHTSSCQWHVDVHAASHQQGIPLIGYSA